MKSKAFTLIELLVVIAIIGILAGVLRLLFCGLSQRRKRRFASSFAASAAGSYVSMEAKLYALGLSSKHFGGKA